MVAADCKILLLGASRGGTTLLAAALGAHSRIAMLDEDMGLALNRITGGKIPAVKLCVPNQIELQRRWHWIYAPGMLTGSLRKSLFMSRVPKSRYAIRDYDRLGTVRHVCILRHPAGVIGAIQAREKRSAKVAQYRYRRHLQIFQSLLDDPAYQPVLVSFEALVRQPETILAALCRALGLEFEAIMLDAPIRNSRYPSDGFDASKADYDEAELIWQQLPAAARAQYETLSACCLS